jgi:hypothetical protein
MCRCEELDFLSFLAARLDGEEKYAAERGKSFPVVESGASGFSSRLSNIDILCYSTVLFPRKVGANGRSPLRTFHRHGRAAGA